MSTKDITKISLKEFQALVKGLVRESIKEAQERDLSMYDPSEQEIIRSAARQKEKERAHYAATGGRPENDPWAHQDTPEYAARIAQGDDRVRAEKQRVAAWRKAHPFKSLFFGHDAAERADTTESYGTANEAHEEGHDGGGGYDRNTDGYLARMTWGVMPSDDLLEVALADGWHMNLKGRDALSFQVAMEMAGLDPGRAEVGMSTVQGMKQVIEALTSCSSEDPEMTEICDSAQSLAGSIMDVLGIEWV